MSSCRNTEVGYVLVVVAATLVILLGFAALAVDVGVMYSAHTAAQRAADAAALAGAYTFIAEPNASDPKTAAETRASVTAVQNTILGSAIQGSDLNPPPFADVANRRVTVNLTHTIPTFFAGVLGQKFATVSVVAYAEAGEEATCSDCVKPWFIPNNVISSLGCGACQASPQQLIALPEQEEPTQYARDYIMTQAPFTIKPSNPANALSPGDFYAIVLPNDDRHETGGDVYRENIAACSQYANMQCGDSYYVKPGNMVGPTKQGTSLLISFGLTDKPNELDPYKDAWLTGDPTYMGPATPLPPAMGGSKMSSHQTVIAPIWDVCSTLCADCFLTPPGPNCGKLPDNGANTLITVIGFARVFISDVSTDGDVSAYLVDVSGCGLAPAPCGGSSVQGYPLRLVRTN